MLTLGDRLIIGFLVATVVWTLFGLPFIYLHWDWLMNEAVGFFTFLLFVVGGLQLLLFFWQLTLIRQSLAPAQAAADAALLSARAAIAIELPIIRAEAGKLGYGTSQDGAGQRRYVYIDNLMLSNLGRTKAFPVEIQFGCTIGDKLPEVPTYPHTKPFRTNAILEPDPKGSAEVPLREFDFDAPAEIYERLRSNSVKLWFYCNLVYLDFMDARHEVGFCWRQVESFGMGVFRADPTLAYNKKT
jgi:hypothetical protein